jgi:hypothetical protein
MQQSVTRLFHRVGRGLISQTDEDLVRDQSLGAVVYDQFPGQQRVRYLDVFVGASHEPGRAPTCFPDPPNIVAQAHPVSRRERAMILEENAVKKIALQDPAQHQSSQNRHCE